MSNINNDVLNIKNNVKNLSTHGFFYINIVEGQRSWIRLNMFYSSDNTILSKFIKINSELYRESSQYKVQYIGNTRIGFKEASSWYIPKDLQTEKYIYETDIITNPTKSQKYDSMKLIEYFTKTKPEEKIWNLAGQKEYWPAFKDLQYPMTDEAFESMKNLLNEEVLPDGMYIGYYKDEHKSDIEFKYFAPDQNVFIMFDPFSKSLISYDGVLELYKPTNEQYTQPSAIFSVEDFNMKLLIPLVCGKEIPENAEPLPSLTTNEANPTRLIAVETMKKFKVPEEIEHQLDELIVDSNLDLLDEDKILFKNVLVGIYGFNWWYLNSLKFLDYQKLMYTITEIWRIFNQRHTKAQAKRIAKHMMADYINLSKTVEERELRKYNIEFVIDNINMSDIMVYLLTVFNKEFVKALIITCLTNLSYSKVKDGDIKKMDKNISSNLKRNVSNAISARDEQEIDYNKYLINTDYDDKRLMFTLDGRAIKTNTSARSNMILKQIEDMKEAQFRLEANERMNKILRLQQKHEVSIIRGDIKFKKQAYEKIPQVNINNMSLDDLKKWYIETDEKFRVLRAFDKKN